MLQTSVSDPKLPRAGQDRVFDGALRLARDRPALRL
jgi:hypothetical protein